MGLTAEEYRRVIAPERVGRRNYTTGDVARLCEVAPRTVAKWLDTGRMRGFRIPGSQDRRVPRSELIRFMRAHGYDLGPLARFVTFRVLAAGLSAPAEKALAAACAPHAGVSAAFAPTAVAAARLAAGDPVGVGVIDFGVGRGTAVELAAEFVAVGCPLVLGLVGDDHGPDVPAGFAAVFPAAEVGRLTARVRAAILAWKEQ